MSGSHTLDIEHIADLVAVLVAAALLGLPTAALIAYAVTMIH